MFSSAGPLEWQTATEFIVKSSARPQPRAPRGYTGVGKEQEAGGASPSANSHRNDINGATSGKRNIAGKFV